MTRRNSQRKDQIKWKWKLQTLTKLKVRWRHVEEDMTMLFDLLVAIGIFGSISVHWRTILQGFETVIFICLAIYISTGGGTMVGLYNKPC